MAIRYMLILMTSLRPMYLVFMSGFYEKQQVIGEMRIITITS